MYKTKWYDENMIIRAEQMMGENEVALPYDLIDAINNNSTDSIVSEKQAVLLSIICYQEQHFIVSDVKSIYSFLGAPSDDLEIEQFKNELEVQKELDVLLNKGFIFRGDN